MITIDEAIKILEEERRDHHSLSTDIIGQAEGLGIEALKRFSVARKNNVDIHPTLLQGETES